ncbi:MAG: hypothetical protein CM15mP33_00030 [Candidatus Neomarinimicrobiota bacterium]|nr:MAG: hypothetical protein CM15mP33_00030 [Candidatus Neomarinimicrobiota bacterium]
MVKHEEIIRGKRRQKESTQTNLFKGLAQVNGRDSNSYDRKVQLDYEYMKNSNFFMDMKIVFKNFVVILFPKK